MIKRILWNDIKGNRLLAVTTWLFMTVSAFLFCVDQLPLFRFIRFGRYFDGKGTDTGFPADACGGDK